MFISHFFTALSFLTRIPFPQRIFGTKEVNFSKSFIFFPLVGLLIGLFSLLVLRYSSFVFPPLISGLITVGFNAWLTRALHLDGLADWVDGMGGGYTPERRLEIMKDSRIGTFGAIVLVMIILIRASSYGELQKLLCWSGVIMAPSLGRFSMVFLAWRIPLRKNQKGIGSLFLTGFQGRYLAIATLWLLPLASIKISLFTCALAVSIITTLLLRRSYLKNFGRITGDLFGATSEIVETLVLMVALIFAKFSEGGF